jgi:transcriptional antiterminator NusG
MPIIPSAKNQWYVVHVLSNQEQRVRNRILRQIEAEEMGDKIFEVLMPTEIISEVKKGKKSERKKKFYPGYILINMYLLTEDDQLVEDTWYFIKEMDGVIGFAGTKIRPIPMRQREVDAMLAQIKEREESVRPAVAFEVGDSVLVNDGPFQSQNGIVEEIDVERGKLRVAVTIFGRSTPVELEFWQVEQGE